MPDNGDPFDEFPAPDAPAATAQIDGGWKTTTVELTLSLTPFGLPYSSIKLGGDFHHTEPVSDAVHFLTAEAKTRELVETLATDLAKAVTEQVAAVQPALPPQQAAAFASPAPMTAQQAPAQLPQAQPGMAGMRDVVNGQAVPGGVTDMMTVTGRYGDPVMFVPMNMLDSRTFEQQAAQMFCADTGAHPTNIRVFDNRGDLAQGTDRSGHAARIAISNSADPAIQNAFGKRSVAWVDFNRDGSVRVRPTKDFLAVRDPQILLALGEPASGGQAGAGYGTRPF